ncbi:MAG: hypothetical protein ABIJ10_01905 [Candidatus Micrarchaeota archaeon]|nr:hypothetical protein [Candidatus Micrarchaeota archaeon]MBU1887345.1 hypothetical protein [Candidatus Micrarchaeota archaeon]
MRKFTVPDFKLPNEITSNEGIKKLVNRYNSENKKDVDVEADLITIGSEAKQSQCLNKKQLLDIVRWKASRQLGNAKKNDEDWIKEVSHNSFTCNNQDRRIEYLTLLSGVDYATASTILHFVYKDEYPIIDFRALRTVTGNRYETYQYPKLWVPYCKFCGEMTKGYGVDMRTLDKALWQFDNEKYGRK